MALLKTLDEFQQYVRVSGTLTEETINAAVPDAQEKYLRNVLGDELLDDLDTWYNMSTPTTNTAYTALLPYVQRALARFALLVASPEIDVTITESGIGVISNTNIAPASSDRVKKLDNSNEQRAWDNIETLLRFLEENKADYDEWTASTAYTLSIRNMVNSAVEFDYIFPIDKSRLYFNKMRPILDDVDLLRIKPTISAELFDVIVSEIIDADISTENQRILPLLQRAEVFFAAVESLDREKYNGTGVELNKMFLQRDIDIYTNKAELYLGEVRKIIDNNPNDYPAYRDSSVYVGLNDEDETQYGGFDNTATDNHIFVM